MSTPSRSVKVVGEYTIEERIGTGSFASVFRATSQSSAEKVAIKAISRSRLTKKLEEALELEIEILEKLRHKNIVGLKSCIKTKQHIYIILEYCQGGDLHRYIAKHGPLLHQVAHKFMLDLAAGLEFLWSKALVHRDLKPHNLLLTDSTPQAQLKIADFGFARHLSEAAMAETLCGSPLYMAPEILRHRKYDAKADLWSVGTILFQMLVGRPPFHGSNPEELLRNIEKTELRIPSNIDTTPEAVDLIRKLLRRNPTERISFHEFFDSPYLTSVKRHVTSSTTSPSPRISPTATAVLGIAGVPPGVFEKALEDSIIGGGAGGGGGESSSVDELEAVGDGHNSSPSPPLIPLQHLQSHATTSSESPAASNLGTDLQRVKSPSSSGGSLPVIATAVATNNTPFVSPQRPSTATGEEWELVLKPPLPTVAAVAASIATSTANTVASHFSKATSALLGSGGGPSAAIHARNRPPEGQQPPQPPTKRVPVALTPPPPDIPPRRFDAKSRMEASGRALTFAVQVGERAVRLAQFAELIVVAFYDANQGDYAAPDSKNEQLAVAALVTEAVRYLSLAMTAADDAADAAQAALRVPVTTSTTGGGAIVPSRVEMERQLRKARAVAAEIRAWSFSCAEKATLALSSSSSTLPIPGGAKFIMYRGAMATGCRAAGRELLSGTGGIDDATRDGEIEEDLALGIMLLQLLTVDASLRFEERRVLMSYLAAFDAMQDVLKARRARWMVRGGGTGNMSTRGRAM